MIFLNNNDNSFNSNAHLTDNPSVQALPLAARFISWKVGSASLGPRDDTSSAAIPITGTHGGALQGVDVTFAAGAGARLTSASSITDAKGQALTQVSSNNVGRVFVSATASWVTSTSVHIDFHDSDE